MEFKVLATFFIVAKMIIYFILMIQIQEGTDFTECADVVGKTQVFAWLTIEVLLFYINLGSLSFFIFVNLFKKYRSIRDRVGLAGRQRKTVDFLNYAKDDIHWWSTWFNQFVLSVAVLVFRKSTAGDADIKLSVIELFAKHFFGLYLIRQLYFNSKFQFKLKTKVVLVITVLINVAQIARYLDLESQGLNWWSAIYLRDIVIYFVIFIQMLVEYVLWPNKLFKWRQDLVFDQRFTSANEDVSEN